MRIRRVFFAALLLVLVGTGCSKKESQPGDVLRIGIGADVRDVDPQTAGGLSEVNVALALFEGLTDLHPETLVPVPAVAERWKISDDGRTYTFFLRENARWSDGAPVRAEDFVGAYRRMLSPKLGAEYAPMLYVIEGAEAFHKGAATDFQTVGVRAIDERTLELKLRAPAPQLLSMLAHPAWFPVPLKTIAAVGAIDARDTRWTQPGAIVSNGAFVLSDWRVGQRLTLSKNPNYWDAAAVRLSQIELFPSESVDADERAFRGGQLHVTDALPIGKITSYRRENLSALRIEPYLAVYFYRCNMKRPPLDDVRVRRALALAMDRTAIAKQIFSGAQTPAETYVPPTMPGYASDAAARLRTDFDEARHLLAEAGFPGGKNFPATELVFNTSENHRMIAEAVQDTWRRELGIEIQLTNQDFQATLALRRTGGYQLLRSAWAADYADAATFLEVFTSQSGNNFTGWADAEYDAAVAAGQGAADAAIRAKEFARAEAILLRELPILPVYQYNAIYLVDPRVRGWTANPLNRHPLKHVWLSEP